MLSLSNQRRSVATRSLALVEDFVVFIIDHDPASLAILTRLVRGAGYPVRSFSSAREFLVRHDLLVPSCLLLNLDSPHPSERRLLNGLIGTSFAFSVIGISDKDIKAAVTAMKAGATDVLEKPVGRIALVAALDACAKAVSGSLQRQNERAAIYDKFARLSPRELEVLRHVIAGRLNKQIAWTTGIVERTVKEHRSHIMKKLEARNLVELIRMTTLMGLQPNEDSSRSSVSGPTLPHQMSLGLTGSIGYSPPASTRR
jgi:FixJ family two-component response regulator